MILFSPGGVPTEVPRPLLSDYYKRGYSKKYVPPMPVVPVTDEVIDDIDELPFILLDEPSQAKEEYSEDGTKKVYVVDRLTEFEYVPLTEKARMVLNHGNKEELVKIKGIGDKIVQKIVDGRPYVYEQEFEKAVDSPYWKRILKKIEEFEGEE